MKTFYTVRDIEDMHAAGTVEIETHDDVVLTDVAREKAIALGMRLIPLEPGNDPPPGMGRHRTAPANRPESTSAGGGSPPPHTPFTPKAPAPAQPSIAAADADLVMKIKTAVIARLGTDKYNDLLDRIIPRVMSQLDK